MSGPLPGHSDMSLCGVYYAKVTKNKDDEKELARVKVRFPWLPGEASEESHWAQLAVPMTGAEFGTFTLPEIHDMVLVTFVAGDIRQPIVIGGAWSKEDTPPEVNEDGKNDFRLIKSRSGHRLLFDDTDNTKVVATDYTNENFAGCGTFAEGGESANKMEIAAPEGASEGVGIASMQGTVNVWCPSGTLKVTAKDVEVVASEKIAVKAGGNLTIEGGMQAKVAATGAGKYEGSTINVG